MLKRFWHWFTCKDMVDKEAEDSIGVCIESKCFGYRVQVYQADKDVWSFKTSTLYSFFDANAEADKIHLSTGKKTRVLEYWETNKIIKEYK